MTVDKDVVLVVVAVFCCVRESSSSPCEEPKMGAFDSLCGTIFNGEMFCSFDCGERCRLYALFFVNDVVLDSSS
jgi:hypothetical protein